MGRKITDKDKELAFVLNSKMDLYYIEWEDAVANSGWLGRDQAFEWFGEEAITVKQVGWVAEENDHYIGLVGRISDWGKGESEYGQLQKIPKTWIRRKVKLAKYIK